LPLFQHHGAIKTLDFYLKRTVDIRGRGSLKASFLSGHFQEWKFAVNTFQSEDDGLPACKGILQVDSLE